VILPPFGWWTFLKSRAETRENVHDDSAPEMMEQARLPTKTTQKCRVCQKQLIITLRLSADEPDAFHVSGGDDLERTTGNSDPDAFVLVWSNYKPTS
jgi:hypothetical protein